MAWQEVDAPKEEMNTREFVKFNAIGDKVGGFYVGKKTETANFNDGPKQVIKYTFRRTDGTDLELTPPYDLRKRLEKAEADGLLVPDVAVLMTFTATRDVGQASPMKIISLKIDPDIKRKVPPKLYTPPAQAAAPKEDVPF